MAGKDGFEWVDKSTLQSATDAELIEEILTLQGYVSDLEEGLQGLRELVFLLLDIHAGVAAETHPELVAMIEDTDLEPTPGAETDPTTETDGDTNDRDH